MDSTTSTKDSTVRKRIIACCDGTWQSTTSPDYLSNVARLCRVLAKAGDDEKERQWQQIVYYDPGVGTGAITRLEKARQGFLGIGLLDNVFAVYTFIVSNYSPGDQLYLFGFSRGAYTVRSVAGLVHQLGILKPVWMFSFTKLYEDYIKAKDFSTPFPSSEPWKQFIGEHGDYAVESAVEIHFIGVWDTVGSLGVPNIWPFNSTNRAAYEFHDTNLNEGIRYAYQALALDERREVFSPSVWKLRKLRNGKFKTELCQCWFPGTHINVGGGDLSGHHEHLAFIAYAWMLDRIRPHLAIDESALQVQLDGVRDSIARARNPDEAPENRGWFLSLLRNIKDAVMRAPTTAGEAIGYAMGRIDESNTWMFGILGNLKDRTPDRYHDDESEFTVERIHPSVHHRKEQNRGYEPAALRGWIREERDGVHTRTGVPRRGPKWVKYRENGGGTGERVVENELWEFELEDMPEGKSVERRLMEMMRSKDLVVVPPRAELALR